MLGWLFGWLLSFMLLPWTLFARRPSHVIKLSKDRTETLPIRHFKYKGPLWVQSHPYIRTPYDEIKVVAREFPDRPAFGSRSFLSQEGTPSVRGDFVFQTYGQVYHRVLCLAASLLKIGIQRGDKVGYYSNTREEYVSNLKHALSLVFSFLVLTPFPLSLL